MCILMLKTPTYKFYTASILQVWFDASENSYQQSCNPFKVDQL